jgi:site-specific recombinase XerD
LLGLQLHIIIGDFRGNFWRSLLLGPCWQDGGVKKHPPNNHQAIVQAYQQNLRQVAGLAPKTCQDRCRDARRFLAAVHVRRVGDLAALTPVDLVGYLTARSADYAPASLRNIASSVRAFLRFAQQRGWIHQPLELAVPQIACGPHNDLPFYLSGPQLESLLASWDGRTAEGRRDRAIGLCLARLGLRAGEVAGLLLEDIDWRQATLRLRQSKNGCQAQLPLLSEVGQAVADYLRAGRPAGTHRHVFLFRQPARPMDAKAPHPGAHLLRHTLASHLVQNGASLKAVADLLRHRDLNSASVYAHVDLPHLRPLAQPWRQEATL